MKLKRDEHGHVVVQDGNPVYVHDDGKEIPFDAAATVATIGRLNGEAKGHRERAEGAETKLKVFEKITDPAAALAAMETVKNLDTKKLIDAGEVEKVKAEAAKAFEGQLQSLQEAHKPVLAERDALKASLVDMKIGTAFNGSKFVTDKIAVPPDMLRATFGSRFKVEDGAIVGYDPAGNKIFSRAKPGEVAEFDEALGMMVDSYAHRDHILKGSGASGGGANGNGGNAGGKTLSRAAFDALAPDGRMAHIRAGGTLVD